MTFCSPSLPTIGRVPSQFLGLGRSFRDQIVIADDQAATTMIKIFTSFAGRAERGAAPRPEALQDAVRFWRLKMPDLGLLDSTISSSRRELNITEVRVGSGTTPAMWDTAVDEAVTSILVIELRIANGICRLSVEPVALLPLHALGRWYQRSLANDNVPLLASLARLAASYGKILEGHYMTGNRKFLKSDGSGQWAGSLTDRFSETTGRNEKILNVRTFLSGEADTGNWSTAAAFQEQKRGNINYVPPVATGVQTQVRAE
jgi:hypothetical protein